MSLRGAKRRGNPYSLFAEMKRRIPTPVCALARNDRRFREWGCVGAGRALLMAGAAKYLFMYVKYFPVTYYAMSAAAATR